MVDVVIPDLDDRVIENLKFKAELRKCSFQYLLREVLTEAANSKSNDQLTGKDVKS